MGRKKFRQLIDVIAVLLMFAIFIIGYRWFYHHGSGAKDHIKTKLLLYSCWTISVFVIGFAASSYNGNKNLWSISYIVTIAIIFILRGLELKINSFFITSLAAQLKLFLCSPLPYGILLIVRKRFISSDQGS